MPWMGTVTDPETVLHCICPNLKRTLVVVLLLLYIVNIEKYHVGSLIVLLIVSNSESSLVRVPLHPLFGDNIIMVCPPRIRAPDCNPPFKMMLSPGARSFQPPPTSLLKSQPTGDNSHPIFPISTLLLPFSYSLIRRNPANPSLQEDFDSSSSPTWASSADVDTPPVAITVDPQLPTRI